MKSITTQNDDDQRIDVILDAQYTKLLDTGNVNSQNGVLVLELISQDQPTVPALTIGHHITFVGPWVYDTENQWNAIYPVWSITTS